MVEWRLGRGWSDGELADRLAAISGAGRNFDEPVDALTPEQNWHRYYSEAVIARERPGPPVEGGAFERGRTAVSNYQFSDPQIVIAHFEPDSPLLGRRILLELRALRVLHYLGGVVVGDVQSEEQEERSVFGFRYETLEGHIEKGAEWFLLKKSHTSGAVRFRIEAAWRPGQFPNWWSRAGFSLLGRYYQERWHRRAHAALAALVRDPEMPLENAQGQRLVHNASEVIFRRTEARNV